MAAKKNTTKTAAKPPPQRPSPRPTEAPLGSTTGIEIVAGTKASKVKKVNKARTKKAAKAPKAAAADNSILAIHVNRTGRYLFVLNPGRSARRFLRR